MHWIICYSYQAIDRERNDYNNSLPKACTTVPKHQDKHHEKFTNES